MLVPFLLIHVLWASDDDIGLRGRRNVSDILDLQRCYLWNPYSPNNEVSRSFHNNSLSPTHPEPSPSLPLVTPININPTLSSASWSMPTSLSIASPWTLPEPPSCAWPTNYVSPLRVVGVKPHFSSPPLPAETPRSLEEYVKLLPISMLSMSLVYASIM